MTIKPQDFFKEKRSWSFAKDKILEWYLVPYLTKVSRFGKVVVVDGFAGSGLYEDGSEGSPVIICKVIEKLGIRAIAVLIESDKACFEILEKNVEKFKEKNIALPLKGDFKKLTPEIIKATQGCPTFFYIDPFGIKGLELSNLKSILARVNKISTEVLVNFSYKALIREYEINPSLTDKVMGDDKYRAILAAKIADIKKEEIVIERYKSKYMDFFTYVGSCPVMCEGESRAKYHLIFATSHFDGLKLMNERMGDVFRDFYAKGRLFQVFPRDKTLLEKEILKFLQDKAETRKRIKEVLMIKHFLRFKESDYNQVVSKLLKEKKIYSDTGKTRINDNNLLASSSP